MVDILKYYISSDPLDSETGEPQSFSHYEVFSGFSCESSGELQVSTDATFRVFSLLEFTFTFIYFPSFTLLCWHPLVYAHSL